MAFSGALTLTDLNDYITPSQACIKPVEQLNPVKEAETEPGAASTAIRIDSGGAYYEVSTEDTSRFSAKKLEPAQISLNDCLACSGCITSAESVLITLQSHTEVLNFLAANPPPSDPAHKVPVLSVSPQSLASLAASLASSSSSPRPIPLPQILARIRKFAREVLGFEHVWDTTFARHLALLEHVREFRERKAHSSSAGSGSGRDDVGRLPMLASACPGWICYAEKTHAEMLPFIARTKSPQQVMGALVKYWLAPKWGKRPDGVYHVALMPCYDKKLEASRSDFYNEQYHTRDVDCVITTGEFERLLREKGCDLSVPVPDSEEEEGIPDLLEHRGTSSGSYLQSIIDALSSSPSHPQDGLTLSTSTLRADHTTYTLSARASGSSQPVFKGATCYGFRNLQNVVRRVGREGGAYDYVEVMACPGGCVNGGGQLKPPPALDGEGKAWTRRVEEAYWSPSSEAASPQEKRARADRLAARVLAEMCRPDGEYFRTSYRAVESEVVGLAVKW
ncbi:iron hydrogenase [Gloeophyllum trabeum ATCC 11539]|uniref:Iron hydrogenase n=1 Tax=Gloeophyllum trabeum (strain ATCC 11539 / FP-39264 / Madison 617) TaxID=670483 RepID=S7QE26_GLOTA|nr:iron hydrogenase [Gloeophyllum trabeum ATCC 11539]EPQ57538.1 iron hydrogenase [Gloeophyllum trabeum ATCC 11539]